MIPPSQPLRVISTSDILNVLSKKESRLEGVVKTILKEGRISFADKEARDQLFSLITQKYATTPQRYLEIGRRFEELYGLPAETRLEQVSLSTREQKEFLVSKQSLINAGEYFEKMFREGFSEASIHRVSLPLSEEALQHFIFYIQHLSFPKKTSFKALKELEEFADMTLNDSLKKAVKTAYLKFFAQPQHESLLTNEQEILNEIKKNVIVFVDYVFKINGVRGSRPCIKLRDFLHLFTLFHASVAELAATQINGLFIEELDPTGLEKIPEKFRREISYFKRDPDQPERFSSPKKLMALVDYFPNLDLVSSIVDLHSDCVEGENYASCMIRAALACSKYISQCHHQIVSSPPQEEKNQEKKMTLEEVIKHYKHVLGTKGNLAPVYAKLAELNGGQSALKPFKIPLYCKEALKRDPNNVRAHFFMGEMYFKKIEEIVLHFYSETGNTVSMAPWDAAVGHPEAFDSLKERLTISLLKLFSAAIKHVEKAFKLFPKNMSIGVLFSKLILLEQVLLKNKNSGEAIAALEESLANFPYARDSFLLPLRRDLYFFNRDYEKLLALFEHFPSENPFRNVCLFRLGKLTDVKKAFEAYDPHSPQFSQLHKSRLNPVMVAEIVCLAEWYWAHDLEVEARSLTNLLTPQFNNRNSNSNWSYPPLLRFFTGEDMSNEDWNYLKGRECTSLPTATYSPEACLYQRASYYQKACSLHNPSMDFMEPGKLKSFLEFQRAKVEPRSQVMIDKILGIL